MFAFFTFLSLFLPSSPSLNLVCAIALCSFRRLWLIFFAFVSHAPNEKSAFNYLILCCISFATSFAALSPSLSPFSHKESKSDIGADVPSAHEEPRNKRRRSSSVVSWLIYCSLSGPSSSFAFADCPKTVDTANLPKYFHRLLGGLMQIQRCIMIYILLYLYHLWVSYVSIWLIKNAFVCPKCITTCMEYGIVL